MIDRSYLPFQSAREHQDRGMEKWMGFFLSEHTTSLKHDSQKENLSSQLSKAEKLTLIGQLYASQLTGLFTLKDGLGHKIISGQVVELTPTNITLQTRHHYHALDINDIITIGIEEV
ncbi:hypothetical protein JG537_04570 [Streptococcus sp. SL1232]|uniref:hypothetical protein n=1 Tax=Streptococcus vicugnae TaxID=2740579 RepID=UPI0018F773E2|nr:hypothetical protein [Streptococcus vicugnae]MBJ7540992.1 hypothetical protein [Streptococcus vicugnae]